MPSIRDSELTELQQRPHTTLFFLHRASDWRLWHLQSEIKMTYRCSDVHSLCCLGFRRVWLAPVWAVLVTPTRSRRRTGLRLGRGTSQAQVTHRHSSCHCQWHHALDAGSATANAEAAFYSVQVCRDSLSDTQSSDWQNFKLQKLSSFNLTSLAGSGGLQVAFVCQGHGVQVELESPGPALALHCLAAPGSAGGGRPTGTGKRQLLVV
jgi:hypothetical protein